MASSRLIQHRSYRVHRDRLSQTLVTYNSSCTGFISRVEWVFSVGKYYDVVVGFYSTGDGYSQVWLDYTDQEFQEWAAKCRKPQKRFLGLF